MPPKFTARQLQYDAPPVPNFLKQLHNQVNARNGSIEDKRPRHNDDEFDDLIEGASKRTVGQGESNDDDDEQVEEWDGAQVVVLKEGKHLSKDDLESKRREKVQASSDNVDESSSIKDGPPKVTAGVSASSTSNKAGEKMKDVKDLIAQSKATTSEESEADRNQKRKLEREKAREEKNKRAKVEKSKRGKGLSFSIDD